ncbi:MAG: hypothetical protein O7D95_06520 [Betaproteobacteria bacterium]|nr:hypothetical protein [Betaproteobacteria bacterium]
MDNVVSMFNQGEYKTGECKCLACDHEWVGVAPVEEYLFECPECGMTKGQHKYPVMEEGDYYECKCKSLTFTVTMNGVGCANCGLKTSYEELAQIC